MLIQSRRFGLFACFAILAILLFARAVPVAAQEAPPVSGGWQFDLTPYAWFAGMSGDVGAGSKEAPTAASFTDICHNLDSGFMAHFDGRKGRWGFLLDPIYINLGASIRTPYGFKVAINVEQFLMGFEGAYRVYDKEGKSFDVLFGGRYSVLKSDLTPSGVPYPPYHFSKDWVDPMVGFRARFDLGHRWAFGIRGDIGGFGLGSKLAWDAMARFDVRASKSVSFNFGYAVVATDYESGSGSSRFLYDVRMEGPFMGVSFSF